MSKSILERLQELAEKERKRRDRAVKYYFDNGNYENVGFYVTLDDQFTPIGGTNLLSLKGYEFWFRVKQICDWLTNYIPEQIEKADKSRDSRLDHLDKVVNALNEI